ncbi:MAG: c-type cytochrome biogenesis protein CcmI [Casimicrobiaceae bacterium]
MNPALAFVLAALVLAIGVALIVARPLWRGLRQSKALAGEHANLEAARIEWQELKRDRALGLITEDAAEEASRELETRVLAETAPLAPAADALGMPQAPSTRYRKSAVALTIVLPVAAVVAYLLVGYPRAVIPEMRNPDASAAQAEMDELFRAAEAKLAQEPNDVKGWTLLARAKSSVGQFEGAMAAFERAVALDAKDPDLWADYADAAAGAQQGRMEGKPLELIRRALALDAKHPKGLLLLGTSQIQSMQLDDAERTFRLARQVAEPGTAFASIAENALKDIAERRANAAAASGQTEATAGGSSPTEADPPLVRLSLSLSPEAQTAAQAANTAVVFIVVRRAEGSSGPPLAAKRIPIARLGEPILLTAADAMIGDGLRPGVTVSLRARLSLAGQPTPAAGDFESKPVTVSLPAAQVVTLTVDSLVR